MDDEQAKLEQLRQERKRVRNEVYSLGVRLNAGESEVRAALDAAIRRSDELAAEIYRLSAPPAPPPRTGPPVPMPMYGPPANRERRLPRGGFDDSATMYGPPPAPMYGPPPIRSRLFRFLSRLFRRG